MGGDCIPPVILKYAATALAEPIHYLFSLCLSKSYLPAEWRCHCITPIFKSGDRPAVSNYHPISLLCSISKVIERLVFNKIYDYVAKSISISQFGFTRNRSSLQQLLLYSDFIVSAYDNREQVDSIYLGKPLTLFLMQGRRKQFRSGTAMGVVTRSHTLILTLIIWSCTVRRKPK